MKSLGRYYPERYRISRPFSRQVTAVYRSYTGLDSLPSAECFQAVSESIINAYNNEIETLPFEKRPDNSLGVMMECSLAIYYAAFCVHGRQIFHFNEEIAKQFRKTDVDEINIGSLVFPYNTFYMNFGTQSDLMLAERAYVDGAYICAIGGKHLQIVLTTIRDDYNSERFNWIFKPEKYYYLPLSLSDPSQSISVIADKALQEDLAERKQDALSQLPDNFEFQGIEISNRRPETLKVELKEVSDNYSIFREALRLVINGLCYLSAYREDIDTRYPDDAPTELLEKIKNPVRPKDIQSTISKLTSMGYSKINYCGKEFERFTYDRVKGDVKSHWRRGHWRNQSCGSGLSNRKLVWIMPVIVRKDKSESLKEFGHIYIIDNSTNLT